MIVPSSEVYTPRGFVLQAVLLPQAFAHWGRFLTAASRRSGVRVSVPLWLAVLSDQLWVVGLVSHYLTNYLIQRRPIPKRRSFEHRSGPRFTSRISQDFSWLSSTLGQVTYVLLTRPPLTAETVRATCMS